MSDFSGRHVLVVGQRLAPVAQEALTEARFEVAAGDRLDVLDQTHTPTDLTSAINIVPAEHVAHFELRAPNGAVERQDYTLDERGARTALEQVGVNPSLLPISTNLRAAESFQIKARQSTLAVHGGTMDTYLVTMESNGQTLLECHVDQLGRIVRATTLLGYKLAPEDVTP